ncbi:MAG: ergothioneine biosynthesis protein EgtB [Candidatus Latescibacteria bacterium]|nr:ergothioneine biosynthesis protein EgtB [Candidatus Latescibacterota bacterium]
MPSSLQSAFPPATLAAWAQDARQCTFELIADLGDHQLMGPQLSIVNPGLWEIGHLAWFQSFWALRQAAGQAPVWPDEDALYDSIAIAHDIRWDLPLPPRDQTLAYLRQVRDRVLARLQRDTVSDEQIYHALYATLHEDMHTEALTYTRQTLGWPAPKLSLPLQTPPAGGPLEGDVEIPGGTFLLGSTPDAAFVFDNEKWAHPVDIAPFAMARAAVTQAQYAAFVDDGGYTNRALWDAEGWQWRQHNDAQHPMHWRRHDGGWERRHFDQWNLLEAHLPVIHVNWHEAQAYCRWAGRRLPSEAEWELAASATPSTDGRGFTTVKRHFPWGDTPPTPQRANLDWRHMGCVEVGALPEGDSPFGCRQMIGNLWEWTATPFGPFPGFVADPYKEYSEPWFDGRRVMRGGCWTTRSRLIRTNYRNFQTPDRRDVWAGFRTCRQDA